MAINKVPAIIRIRRGSFTQWYNSNPILQEGEMGLIISGQDENKFKVGNGITEWRELPYIIGADGLAASIEIIAVETVENNEAAEVINEGTDNQLKLRLKLPKGIKGDKGDDGIILPDITSLNEKEDINDNDLLFIYDSINNELKNILSINFINKILDNIEVGSKKYASIVIGHVNSGYTSEQVDYLCDGIDDDIEINTAIQSLANGGKIQLLEGTYNLSQCILIDKNNIYLSGCGDSTILNKTYPDDNDDMNRAIIYIMSANYSKIENFNFINTESVNSYGIVLSLATYTTICNNTFNNYSSFTSRGIYLTLGAMNNTINSNIFKNQSNSANCYGIHCAGLMSDRNKYINNIFFNKSENSYSYGIQITGTNQIISNNVFSNSAQNSSYGILFSTANYNIISCNTFSNSSENGTSIGIGLSSSNYNIINLNSFSNKRISGQANTNTWAFYLSSTTNTYNSFSHNNLCGITRVSPAGGQMTINATANVNLPGSATAQAVGAAGSGGTTNWFGFNIV